MDTTAGGIETYTAQAPTQKSAAKYGSVDVCHCTNLLHHQAEADLEVLHAHPEVFHTYLIEISVIH